MSEPPFDARRTMSGHSAPVPSMEDIEARIALDDDTGAAKLARLRAEGLPDDAQAQVVAERCEARLIEIFLTRLGDLSRAPRVVMSGDRRQWLSIDHRAGFVVSRIDGSTTLEEWLEISAMSRLDALAILHDLLEQKVVAID